MPALPVSSALHLLEGRIWREERRGWRLSNAGQLVGCRPKAGIGVCVFQEQVQRGRIPALRGNDDRVGIANRSRRYGSRHFAVIHRIDRHANRIRVRPARIVGHGLVVGIGAVWTALPPILRTFVLVDPERAVGSLGHIDDVLRPVGHVVDVGKLLSPSGRRPRTGGCQFHVAIGAAIRAPGESAGGRW
jgi:hypothetical protein